MAVKVDDLMGEIEDEVRRARRKRLLAHGAASDYQDARIYAHVDGILRRAIELRDHEALLLPELAGGDDSCRLTTHLRFASHRRSFGAVVIFAKRRILLPAMRWLYEYSLNNFRRQDRVNQVLFACIEELAIEHARLRLALSELQDYRNAGLQEGTSGSPDGEIEKTSESKSSGPANDAAGE